MNRHLRDYFLIEAPTVRDLGPATENKVFLLPNAGGIHHGAYLIPILETAKKPVRNALEVCAYYFRREFDYDFVQYSAEETRSDTARPYAFGLHHQGYDSYRIIGGLCFRKRSYNNTGPESFWALQWVWVHPMMRGKQVLSGAWHHFDQYAPFNVEEPLSHAMEGFLSKHGGNWKPEIVSKKDACG